MNLHFYVNFYSYLCVFILSINKENVEIWGRMNKIKDKMEEVLRHQLAEEIIFLCEYVEEIQI